MTWGGYALRFLFGWVECFSCDESRTSKMYVQHWIKLNLLLRHVSESWTGVDSFFELARWLPSWCIFHISKVSGLLIEVSSVLPPTLTFPSPARAVLRFVSLLVSIKFTSLSFSYFSRCMFTGLCSSRGLLSWENFSHIQGFLLCPSQRSHASSLCWTFLRTISPPG